MAWACVTDEGQQTDQRCTPVEANREKIKRKTEDGWTVEEDLRRAGVTKCGKHAGRQRMTLNDIAADRQQWRNLTAASMAEISWTIITGPNCNLAMSFAVTQSNQLLFQSLCN